LPITGGNVRFVQIAIVDVVIRRISDVLAVVSSDADSAYNGSTAAKHEYIGKRIRNIRLSF